MLDTPISQLPKTRAATIARLKSLDVKTFGDLLNYFPNRYEDYSLIAPIATVQEGETVTVKGHVKDIKTNYARSRFTIQKAFLGDDSGAVIELVWYNQPYITGTLKQDDFIAVSGPVKQSRSGLVIEPRSYEKLADEDSPLIHTGRLVPVYPEKRGLSSKTIRDKVRYVLSVFENFDEYLPDEIVKKEKLLDLTTAYRHIHFPDTKKQAEAARLRLSFDELFLIQLKATLVREEWKKEQTGHAFDLAAYKPLLDEFVKRLPFELTSAQKKVIQEILTDLTKKSPMNRLLQGDVGSGKTVVAAIAAYAAHLNGFQTLVMAPTEILAKQHFDTLEQLFKNLPVKLSIKTASQKKVDEDAHIVVGTHALLTGNVEFKKVGLVVVDEQHRFGVRQRTILKQKGANPHLLTMTATPIPRTVALTLYAELDMSRLDEMPHGRLPIKTHVIPPHKRDDGYEWMRKKMREEGDQIFVICPLIEESDHETMKSIKAASVEYEKLSKVEFKDFSCALLHGKVKPAEKERIMSEFKNKKYDVLVATSLVEVGIDIPGATIMLIEGSERFGLAQLHQLRGRVGRGSKQSYCFLFTESAGEKVKERLNFFAKNTSGEKLAQYDLEARGAGEIYGTKQHGMSMFKVATLTDYELLERVRDAVNLYLAKYRNSKSYPLLEAKLASLEIGSISPD